MNKQQVLETLKYLRENSSKRNFSQSVDLIINLQNLDLKKPEHKIEFYMQLPKSKNKKVKIGGFVDAQLATQAKKVLDTVILKDELDTWKQDIKKQKKLANSHDFFIAQVDIMAKTAATFGKVLGSRGKMPNPKAGCVVPGTANLEPIVKKLQDTIKIQTKNELSIKASIALESMNDEDIAENAIVVYNNLVPKLPQEKNNIKDIFLKFTMSPAVKVGEKPKQETKVKENKK
ncbi:50S ribosomal protein L1 [Candidatus Woesearchaeota archaeon]|nr:50S ribosomal protein L1 [Candidatus Woesearchaeota archaeon]